MKLEELFLKEGGYALKDAGVGRIAKGDIPPTMKYVSKISGIPEEDLVALGSVGKAASSGDIDIALDVDEYSPMPTHEKMVEALGEENAVYNKGNNIGSYAVPVAGDEKKGKVQVDFMFVENVNWAKFAYYSEGDNSKYKGAIRTILIMGVAAALNEPGTDHFEYNMEGDLIVRAGRTLDLNKGLRRIFQFRPPKKRGGGYTKTMKSISVNDFKQMYPDVEVHGDNLVIDDPDTVVQMLFGKGVTAEDVSTAEKVLKLIKAKFSEKDQEKIFSFASNRAKAVGSKMKLPKELM